MTTLENRTHEGAGVVSRMWHNLGEAVRGILRTEHEASVSGDATVHAFFEAHGIPLVTSLPDNVQTFTVTVKGRHGTRCQAFLSNGNELYIDEPKVALAMKAFVEFKLCLFLQKNLSLVQAEFVVTKNDGRWVLAEIPSADRMQFVSGEILSADAVETLLQVMQTKRAA
jgi:hypothetical protein